jgi:hypothetical protein
MLPPEMDARAEGRASDVLIADFRHAQTRKRKALGSTD